MKKYLKFIILAIICTLTVFLAAKDSSIKIVHVDGNYFRYLSNSSSSENDGISVCSSYDDESPNPDAENAIAEGLTELRDEIDISRFNLSETEFSKVYDRVLHAYSPFFYVDRSCSYTFGNDHVLKLYPIYSYDLSEIPAMQKAYSDKLNEILSQVQPGWSDLEKALFFHDYIVANFTYDYSYSVFDTYTFLTGGTGVCQSYAGLYGVLCESVGIKVAPVSSNTMVHAWNKVYIDGEWYHVDCTWDDRDKFGIVNHDYFLLSDSEMLNRKHKDWYSTVSAECTSTKFDNYYWNDVTTPIVYADGNWYYIAEGAVYNDYYIMKTSDLTVGTPAVPLNSKWSYWGYCFSGLFIMDGRLIYNTTDSIIAYDPTDGSFELLGKKENSDSSYLIYGCALRDGEICYDLKTNPNLSADIKKLSAPTPGDLNLDGKVNAVDISLLRKYLAGGYNILINRTAADYDGNGTVNMKDVSLLKRYIAG